MYHIGDIVQSPSFIGVIKQRRPIGDTYANLVEVREDQWTISQALYFDYELTKTTYNPLNKSRAALLSGLERLITESSDNQCSCSANEDEFGYSTDVDEFNVLGHSDTCRLVEIFQYQQLLKELRSGETAQE